MSTRITPQRARPVIRSIGSIVADTSVRRRADHHAPRVLHRHRGVIRNRVKPAAPACPGPSGATANRPSRAPTQRQGVAVKTGPDGHGPSHDVVREPAARPGADLDPQPGPSLGRAAGHTRRRPPPRTGARAGPSRRPPAPGRSSRTRPRAPRARPTPPVRHRGQGGGVAQVVGADTGVGDVEGQGRGLPRRAAARQGVEQVDVVELPHRPQQRGQDDRVLQMGQGDVPELLEPAGPVERSATTAAGKTVEVSESRLVPHDPIPASAR